VIQGGVGDPSGRNEQAPEKRTETALHHLAWGRMETVKLRGVITAQDLIDLRFRNNPTGAEAICKQRRGNAGASMGIESKKENAKMKV